MAQLFTTTFLNDRGVGVRIDQFDELETLTVSTENTDYEITVLCGKTGDVQLLGGRHFPEKTRARLLGASAGGSLLKVQVICVGLNMEFIHEGRRIVTSPVCSIAIG